MLASTSLPTDLGGGRWWSAATERARPMTKVTNACGSGDVSLSNDAARHERSGSQEIPTNPPARRTRRTPKRYEKITHRRRTQDDDRKTPRRRREDRREVTTHSKTHTQ